MFGVIWTIHRLTMLGVPTCQEVLEQLGAKACVNSSLHPFLAGRKRLAKRMLLTYFICP